ncbi:hypothetical protein ACS0TY_003977 [Phlomoides rotata]
MKNRGETAVPGANKQENMGAERKNRRALGDIGNLVTIRGMAEAAAPPLPFLNTDLEVNWTYPPAVEDFRLNILIADALIFALPNYNYSVSGPLKNTLDWGSRPPNVWANKTAAVVSAAGGSKGQQSQYHLRQIGVFLDLHFINKPEFFLNVHQSPRKFDDDRNLIDSKSSSAKHNKTNGGTLEGKLRIPALG